MRRYLGHTPSADDLFAFETLIGLLLTNGPGAISAQGAKGAVSADGPEQPERVQLNKALIGFLTHSGYAHGGNGYEGIAFLVEQFQGQRPREIPASTHGIDLKAMATKAVEQYAKYKAQKKTVGSLDIAKLPGVNHPVFKDKPVNYDPREVFIAKLFRRARREQHIPPVLPRARAAAVRRRRLAQRLLREHRRSDRGAAAEDALEAAAGWKIGESELETAAFTIFLYPRMLGCAAEIDDHLNRGRNMDTRTPASACKFVA